MVRLAAAGCLVAFVAGCGPDYSPNTYSSAAVQQANKVEKGIVIGVRQIQVSAQGVVGTATGAAAGGVIGSTAPGGTIGSTFGALGGGLVGGIIGSSVEHAQGDTPAYEYIVRKPNNDLVSVTQRDPVALALGQHVLVIGGNQARIVPDYTIDPTTLTAPPSASGSTTPPAPTPAAAAPGAPTPLTPPPAAPPAAAPSAGTESTEPPPVPVSAAPLPQTSPAPVPAAVPPTTTPPSSSAPPSAPSTP